MLRNRDHSQSLYVTLGLIIVSTVLIIMSMHSAYTYVVTKNNTIEEMKQSSKRTIVALEKNVSGFMSSFEINEYDKLIFNEMESQKTYAIIVEDYGMGRILGKDVYVSGKIRNDQGAVVAYEQDNTQQNKKLKEAFYSDKFEITDSLGNKLGVIRIYMSDDEMNKKLDEIVVGTLFNTVAVSLFMIIALFIAMHVFIFKPLSKIISIINNNDEDGLPVQDIPYYGSTEIRGLSETINNMVQTIKASRIILTEKNNALIKQDDQLQTLSLATEQSPASILMCDPDDVIEYVNPQFEITSGYESAEVLARPIDFLFQGEKVSENQLAEIKQYLKAHKRWVGEVTLLSKEGDNYFIKMSASPITAPDGVISHYVYVAEDVTEAKRNEEMLRNSQKMEAVGQLTGGIAHDFNNLLGIIMGNLELLKMDLKDPGVLDKIESALAGTVRGAKLTRKLLNFSRQDSYGQELVQVNPFIENLQELIEKSITTNITVETHLLGNLWPVVIDPGDFEDSILNLSLNARDAMLEGGLLIIETTNKQLDSNYVKQNPNSSVGDYVMVSVSDTGSGISEKNRKKIFDPFFTTKEFGKSTGLGLSMVYGFVRRSGGHIQLYSEEGVGSSFNMYFPRAVGEGVEQVNSDDHVELPRGDELILIVDDEVEILMIAEGYLQQLGYRTLVANNAEEALDILSSTEDIDLIFSDVVMSGMSGFELAFATVKQRPSIKILLTSGFTSKHMKYVNDKQKIYLKLSETLLEKPYNLNELAFSIRHTLDEKTPL